MPTLNEFPIINLKADPQPHAKFYTPIQYHIREKGKEASKRILKLRNLHILQPEDNKLYKKLKRFQRIRKQIRLYFGGQALCVYVFDMLYAQNENQIFKDEILIGLLDYIMSDLIDQLIFGTFHYFKQELCNIETFEIIIS